MMQAPRADIRSDVAQRPVYARRMKIFSAILAAALLWGARAEAKEVKGTFAAPGWECAGCAKKTVKALTQIDGVKQATPDLAKKEIAVTYDDTRVKQADIEAAIKKLKFGCEDE
jgi:copper chaperone CopZ